MSKFRSMAEDEKSAWRALPATQALLELLKVQWDEAKTGAVRKAFKGEAALAQGLAGTALGIEETIMSIEARGVEGKILPPKDDFFDPARRASLFTKGSS